jgi:hypothetical protein
MVSVLASSAVEHGLEPRSGQTKDYKIGICCFSAKHAANSEISAISWWDQVNYQWDDDDEVRFILDKQAELDVYSARLLKQQSAGRHVAPLGHIIMIPSQPVFALLNNHSLTHSYLYTRVKSRVQLLLKCFIMVDLINNEIQWAIQLIYLFQEFQVFTILLSMYKAFLFTKHNKTYQPNYIRR